MAPRPRDRGPPVWPNLRNRLVNSRTPPERPGTSRRFTGWPLVVNGAFFEASCVARVAGSVGRLGRARLKSLQHAYVTEIFRDALGSVAIKITRPDEQKRRASGRRDGESRRSSRKRPRKVRNSRPIELLRLALSPRLRRRRASVTDLPRPDHARNIRHRHSPRRRDRRGFLHRPWHGRRDRRDGDHRAAGSALSGGDSGRAALQRGRAWRPRQELSAPPDHRGRRGDLRRRGDPRAHHDRTRLADRRQCVAHAERAARRQRHAGASANRSVRWRSVAPRIVVPSAKMRRP